MIGLEACGGAHYWARELAKLGHDVRLMPPQYVRPYVKTNKHDAADAEACCEEVQRPGMRFVPVKHEQQQALLMLHRIRDRLIAERTGTINASRGHMAEFGMVAAQRAGGLKALIAIIADGADARLPAMGARSWCCSSSTCARSRPGSPLSMDGWSGKRGRTTPAGVLPRRLGSDRLSPPPWWPRSATPGSSAVVEASPPGSV